MSKKTTVVETKGAQAVAVAASDYSAYAGFGFESHTRDDYSVPFLGILQSNSPMLDTSAEARAGMLVNTVTQDIFDGKKGVSFIPVDTQHNVIEWKPREQGGGFVATHTLESDLVKNARATQEFGKWKSPQGNELIETFSVYGLFVTPEGASEQMIISFSSTKIKAYKRWMTKARTIQIPLPNGARINPPLFAHIYHISTVLEKNTKGSYYNFNIDFGGKSAEEVRLPTTHPLFQEAAAFFSLLKEGQVKAAYASQTQTDAPVDDDIPFA